MTRVGPGAAAMAVEEAYSHAAYVGVLTAYFDALKAENRERTEENRNRVLACHADLQAHHDEWCARRVGKVPA